MARCKDCGALIDWMKNTETGKKMPVDREEVCFIQKEKGKIRFMCRREIVRGYQVGDAYEEGYELGNILHWDSCRGERKWRE